MTGREKKLVKSTIVILILCVGFFYIVDPIWSWWSSKSSHANLVSTKYEKFKADVAQMEQLDKSCKSLKEKLGNPNITLGSSREVIEAIASVSKLLKQGGFNVNSMRPGPMEKSKGSSLSTITLYVSGESDFNSIIRMVDTLEHGDITCNPVKLSLVVKDENSGSLNVDMQITVYLWPPNIEKKIEKKEDKNA